MDLTLTRINQIRDVITVRQSEELESRLQYKEIEVRAVTGAIHSAAGNRQGAKNAQKFKFHAQKPAEIPTGKARQMFAVDPVEGLITDEMLAAEMARLQGAGQ